MGEGVAMTMLSEAFIRPSKVTSDMQTKVIWSGVGGRDQLLSLVAQNLSELLCHYCT